MNDFDKTARRFFQNLWVQIGLGFVGLVSGLLEIQHGFQVTLLHWIIAISGLLFVVSVGVVRRESSNLRAALAQSETSKALLASQLTQTARDYGALRQCPALAHKINHDYRDVLSRLFGHPVVAATDHSLDDEQNEEEDRLRRQFAEWQTATAVCQKIAQIFTVLTSSHCIVTVKLIDDPEKFGGRFFCKTYARSETSRRDEGPNKTRRFELRTGENTALDAALTYTPGHTTRFFAADLDHVKPYRNERQDWRDFYRSAIVVPIRCVHAENAGQRVVTDDIGFLTVDTTEPNRLENTFHPEILAGFADQMYNFMSLMRGTYRVPPRD